MEISASQILSLFADSSSKEEFELKCASMNLDVEGMMKFLNTYVKSCWDGQWTNSQVTRFVTLDEFFEMKQRLGKRVEGSWMNDLCKQMCYVVSSSSFQH